MARDKRDKKRRLCVVSAPLMMCVLLTPAAPRAQEVTPIDAVVTHVNVRANPPADTTRVGALNPGETAVLLDSIPSFYKVRLDNAVEGFVSKRWTRIIEASRVDFKIHFLDDGRGDVAIIDVGQHEIIVDGGFSTRILHDYNRDKKIIDGPIELIIVTHADSDHWRGLRRILGFDTIGTYPHSMLEFWEPGYDRDCDAGSSATENYLDFIEEMEDIDAATQRRPLEDFIEPTVDSGDLELVPLPNVPEVKLTLLHSEKDPGGEDCSYQINNASIVFMAEIDTFRFLFTGDANGKERDELGPGTPGHVEAMLLALEESHPGLLRAHLLKAPHHGSETASTQAFIDAVDPEIVVFSASTVHGLPRTAVVERYNPNQRTILRTDRNPGNDNDHILCQVESGTLMCGYLDEL